MVANTDCESTADFNNFKSKPLNFRDLAHMFTVLSEIFREYSLELHIAVPPPLYYGFVTHRA